MPCIFVCYGGTWKDDERDYIGGNLEDLEVRGDIGYEELLLDLYKPSGIDLNHHDLILRCLYNFGSRVPTYLIRNDHELHLFLNGDDACRPPIYLSTNVKYSGGLGSDMKSSNCSCHPNFPYNLGLEYPPPYYPAPPSIAQASVEEYFPITQ